MEFLDQIGRRLQEVVPLVQGIPEQTIALDWVTLEKHHLLEVADATMRHLSAFTGGSSSEVIGVNDGAFESPAGCIENHTCSVSTTPNDKHVEFNSWVFEVLQVLISRLHFEFVLDAHVLGKTVKRTWVELLTQHCLDEVVLTASLSLTTL